MNGGTAIFYDGLTARRHAALVHLDAEGLTVTEDGALLARWPYAELRQQDAPGFLRLAAARGPDLARVEITDAELAAEILRRSPQIGAAARASRKGRAGVVFWSIGAAASLIFTAVYLVPQMADRVAPLVPASVERHLGAAVDNQVRTILGRETCSTTAGDAALAALQASLGAGAGLPVPVEITVLQSAMPNALALPGGRIYVLSGLLDRTRNVDELAGVLAHEIGHVAHRDGLRLLLQQSASSFLIGLLFGDVLGGGTLVMIGRTLTNTAYSREAESAADAFAADLMLAKGRSPAALAEFLDRLTAEFGGDDKKLAIVSSHPLTEERKTALSRGEARAVGAPLLGEAAWQALKTICARPPGEGTAKPSASGPARR